MWTIISALAPLPSDDSQWGKSILLMQMTDGNIEGTDFIIHISLILHGKK